MTETTARSPEAPEKATPEDLRDASKILARMDYNPERVQLADRLANLADELDSPTSMQEIREAVGDLEAIIYRAGEQGELVKGDEYNKSFDAMLSLISRRLQATPSERASGSAKPTFIPEEAEAVRQAAREEVHHLGNTPQSDLLHDVADKIEASLTASTKEAV